MIPADQDLLNAHEAGDTARLCVLYHQAALASDDIDAACFYATHAYVFALECDHPCVPKFMHFWSNTGAKNSGLSIGRDPTLRIDTA